MPKPHVKLAPGLLLLTTLIGLLLAGNLASAQQPGTAASPSDPSRALSSAISDGNLQAVRAALAAGADVNKPNQYGQSPLASAVQRSSLPIIQLLLAHGANARARDAQGDTLLMLYASATPAIAKLLIARGTPVNAHNRFGDTALTDALTLGSPAQVAVLLAAGADPNAAGQGGETPLLDSLLQALNGDTAGVRLLLAHGAKVNKTDQFGQAPLEAAAREGEAEVVMLLLKHGAAPSHLDRTGSTALMGVAGQGGHGNVLIASHPHDDPFPSPTQIAAAMRHAAVSDATIVQALLAAGVKAPGLEGRTALLLASASGNVPVMRVLLAARANPNAAGTKPLYSLTLIKLFEEPGYDELSGEANQSVPQGLTPLMYAAYNGQTEAVQALLTAKASANLQDSTGSTALMYACDKGREATTVLLLKHSASASECDREGRTALLRLAALGAVSRIARYGKVYQEPTGAVTALEGPQLENEMKSVNAEIKARNQARTDQRQKAVKEADAAGLALARALLAAGADLSVEDSQGNTALMLAEKTNHAILVPLLRASL